MATALYIVIQSQEQWWVDFEGHGHGPFESREQAALEARNQAQFMTHLQRAAEVLVPDGKGKYWIVWSSRADGATLPRPVSSHVPKAAAA
ncbi:MAG: hypothetical protein ABI697_13510 [Devosia sp.]